MLEWADLRAHGFRQPFFDRTLARWRADGPPATLCTDLSTLAALDCEPSLDPDLIIAHPSRCGSSLLARLAAAGRQDTVLVSEPPVLAELLNSNLQGRLGQPVEAVLRQVVRAFGRIRLGHERRYVLKLPSNMSRFLPEFRRAFPATPIVWLQRRPGEILESNLSHPARPRIPLSPSETVDWVVRRVTLAFMAATAFVDEAVEVMVYRDLPGAAFARIEGWMGAPVDAEGLSRLRAVAGVHGHNHQLYVPRPQSPLPPALISIVRETLDPMYEAVAARGRGH
ncbi:MAG: Aspartyl/Asparaginyl beta-hydroxylase [Caulobacteraceae bacterium]|nr:Aspartyl/Asparaginyl beta-hydroxylase [Caulobacteraceae bacterium]